ncbi:MAG: hypothetical protein QW614_04020 [Candidatus Caldarchaeum sp.]|uniref:Lactate racemase C-terminal domain-containing protein n=1 Tax=Caldiarchaeum subterraneum TaxID=311458 RepID=A0A7C5LBM0_CALS0
MVELWFKYGRTEIFTDVEDSLEILSSPQTWSATEQLKQQVSSRVSERAKTLVIDYLHSVEGFEQVITSTVEALQEGVDTGELDVMVTCWRYNEPQVEKSLFNHVKSLLKDLGLAKVEHIQKLTDVDLAEGLAITPSVYWDCEPAGIPYFLRDSTLGLVVSPVVGCGGVVSDVLVGEVEEVYAKSSEMVERLSRYTSSKAAEILLIGGPGYPVDSRLSSCIDIASAVANVEPGKVVVLIIECSEGLGGDEFVALLAGGSPQNDTMKVAEKRLATWRKIADKHKLCLVTALPSTVVTKLLNARQMDTLDQALTYGWRVKSKEATVLAVPNSVGTCLTGF